MCVCQRKVWGLQGTEGSSVLLVTEHLVRALKKLRCIDADKRASMEDLILWRGMHRHQRRMSTPTSVS